MRERLSFAYDCMTVKGIYPMQYRKYAKQPVVPNKVILLEPRFRQTTDSLLQIKRRLEEIGGYDIVEISLGLGLLHLKDQHKNIMPFLREMATARYVFTTDANKSVGGFTKRPETTVVQVWHACGAFKRFGFSSAAKLFGGNQRRQEIIKQHNNYDIVTVSSPEVVWAYEEAMGLEGQGIVKPLGVSRTDVFYDDAFVKAAVDRVHEAVPFSRGKKIILYAPTFRGRVNEAVSPDDLDIRAMRDALGDEYVLLTKHHPFVKRRPVIPEDCRDFARDVTEDLEIDQLLCASDVCISDYSSLIFEYSLFERPMIFFAPDIENYDDWRGFYYDYDEMTPGPVYQHTEDVIRYIQNIDSDFDRQIVVSFKKKFMGSCDGHVTDRILREVGIIQ